jgi:O-antigen ligase
MRLYVLYILVLAMVVYAWRDWFISLCGLIVLTALMGHPDMPRQILGIQGLNLWNILLVAILVPWALQRRGQGLRWDLPRWATGLLVFYVLVIVVAYLRAALDLDSFPKGGAEGSGSIAFTNLTSDHLINSLKYLVPGLLLYDGCRTRRRVVLGLVAALMMAVLYSAVVARAIPLSGLKQTGKAEMKQRRRIGKRLGFHANSVAMICASGFWGILALSSLRKRRLHFAVIAAAALLVALGLALSRSRGGYVAFVGIGLLFAVFLWRRMLILFPAVIALIVVLFPGIPQRMMAGVGVTDVSGDDTHDAEVITAGRSTDIWPPVIEQIGASPLLGYGRLAILRTSTYEAITAQQGVCPGHPHNAYLELLLDSGIVGLVPIVLMYGLLFVGTARLSCDRNDPISRAAGGAGLAAIAALLIMGMSGQSFFPKENAQMSWCLWGIAVRVWIERSRSQAWARQRQHLGVIRLGR